MPDEPNFERQLVDHLDHVNRVVRFTCRRQGFGEADAEDCSSWVSLKLVEDNYAVLRAFRGSSSLKTYLTVVVVRLVRDYRVQQWGRWRPSALARRLGELAVRLETLIYRDGLTFDQAAQLIQSGSRAAGSVRELAALHAKLPPRGPQRPREISVDEIDRSGGGSSAHDAAEQAEHAHESTTLEAIVGAQLQQLPALDRVVIRMTYMEGLSVADVARGLNIPQKPLYRQIERLKRVLREKLEAAGVSRERVSALVQEGG